MLNKKKLKLQLKRIIIHIIETTMSQINDLIIKQQHGNTDIFNKSVD